MQMSVMVAPLADKKYKKIGTRLLKAHRMKLHSKGYGIWENVIVFVQENVCSWIKTGYLFGYVTNLLYICGKITERNLQFHHKYYNL